MLIKVIKSKYIKFIIMSIKIPCFIANLLLSIVTVTILIKLKSILAMIYFVDVQLENDMIYEGHKF